MQDLDCTVCLEPALSTMSCTQCKQLPCRDCSKKVEDKCPSCRAHNSIVPNYSLARRVNRLINNKIEKIEVKDVPVEVKVL